MSYSLPSEAKAYLLYKQIMNDTTNNSRIIALFANDADSKQAYLQLQQFGVNMENIVYLPSFDRVPYDQVAPKKDCLFARAAALNSIADFIIQDLPCIILTKSISLLQKVGDIENFIGNNIKLFQGQEIRLQDVQKYLHDNGYVRTSSAIEAGQYAVRSEIIDVVTADAKGFRIYFAWNSIEAIRNFDVINQVSVQEVETVNLCPASELILSSVSIECFKKKFLRAFGLQQAASPLYISIAAGANFYGHENLLPLFFDKTDSVYNWYDNWHVIYNNDNLTALEEYQRQYEEMFVVRQQANMQIVSAYKNDKVFYHLLEPAEYIVPAEQITSDIKAKSNVLLNNLPNDCTVKILPKIMYQSTKEQVSIQSLLEKIIADSSNILIICCNSDAVMKRTQSLLQGQDSIIINIIQTIKDAKPGLGNILMSSLNISVVDGYYQLIAASDIVADNFVSSTALKPKDRLKIILDEIDNIIEGELVVHKLHGVGRFETITKIQVTNHTHDCLKIIYRDGDIFYLPVENINQIKKYGSDVVELDKLGGVAWQRRASKAKKEIFKIAERLMQIAAKRFLFKQNEILLSEESYEKFCKNFGFVETEDQLRAIEEIKQDLFSGHLMDRLVCGDVGFGKTEVAMRAAYMVVKDINHPKSQVAIIAPTTILSRQHYINFVQRFAGTGVKIAQISRLVPSAARQKIKAQLAAGELDIVIGTHALIAQDVKFNNLKLLVIDEEHRFGVIHKEKIKELKENIHVLAMSATPIPRTLHMSLLGIKDLSLIATAPFDRLPVKTFVSPFDMVLIRDILLREKQRGGRSYYVCPRISDIEYVAERLQEFVPEIKFAVAHGQMKSSLIESAMEDFAAGNVDVLLSTTIIESGIDIKAAGTIVMHKSDLFGLSQLYQLRGRVGRSKEQGFAYLTVMNSQRLNSHTLKRLELLENIDSLGAGFTIASHDMDIRGFGNLVGDKQSGNVKEVGVELYQEMLQEAINSLKNQKDSINDDQPENNRDYSPSLNLGLPIYIPEDYITDNDLRLAMYRRIGDISSLENYELFVREVEDRFGKIPQSMNNLLDIVMLKQDAKKLFIENIDSGPSGFVIKFDPTKDCSERVMNFIRRFPRHAKIKPDKNNTSAKLIFLTETKEANVLIKTKKLLQDLQQGV